MTRALAQQAKDELIPLHAARWKLARVWFLGCGALFVVMVIQTLGGAYGDNAQRAWGWAFPNFLPTLALMISVFAAHALQSFERDKLKVRKNFLTLAFWMSIFYLTCLFMPILAPPILSFLTIGSSNATERLNILELSNLWLGPLQGLVVAAIGVLFFLKESKEGG